MESNRLTVLSARIADALRKRPRLRGVLSNTAWMYADRILRMTVGLLVGVWLVRYLGPHAFGQYSYAVARRAPLRVLFAKLINGRLSSPRMAPPDDARRASRSDGCGPEAESS